MLTVDARPNPSFEDRVPLYSPGCPGTLRDLSAFVAGVLELQITNSKLVSLGSFKTNSLFTRLNMSMNT